VARPALLGLALLLALVSPAAANEDALRGEARQHFDAGTRHFEQREYRLALEDFARAYERAPYPDLVYNMARCREELGDYAGAIADYQRFRAVQTQASLRELVDDKISKLRERGPGTPIVLATLASAPPPRPVYKRWWPWTILGVGLAAVGLGVGLGLGLPRTELTYPPVTQP
jgi:tetratricopeptide (TPR) repeat protein